MSEKVKVNHHGLGFSVWMIGWLFTIGYVGLGFWPGVLALFIWPWYLGARLAGMS